MFLTLVWHVTYDRAIVGDPLRSAIVDERPPLNRPPLQPSPWHDSTPKQDMDVLRGNELKVFQSMGWQFDQKDKERHDNQPVLPRIPDSILEKVASRPGMASTRPAGGNR